MKSKLFIFILFFCNSAFAQDIFISSVSPGVNILSGNTSVAAKKGNKISNNSTLQLKDNGTCMIVDTKGRSVYLKSAGNYTYKSLNEMLSKRKEDDLVKGYVDMLLKNMFTHGDAGQTSVTTAVHRGRDLMKIPNDYTIVMGGVITLRWTPPTPKSWVRLVLRDDKGKIIDSVFKASGTTINSYRIPDGTLKAGIAYMWKSELFPERQHSDIYFHLLFADKADEDKIKKDVAQINKGSYDKNTRGELWKYLYFKWEKYYSEK